MQGKKSAEFFRGVSWNLIGNFTYAVCVWLFSFVISKYSGPGNYADASLYAVALSLGNIFFVLSNYGMRSYQVSDIASKYLDADYVTSRYITCALAFVSCVITSFCIGYSMRQIIAIVIFMFYISFRGFSDVTYGIIQLKGRVDICGKSLSIHGVAEIAAFTVCYVGTGNLLCSLAIHAVTTGIITVLFDAKTAKKLSFEQTVFKPTVQQWHNGRRLLSDALPLFLCAIAGSLLIYSPRLILEKLADGDAVGVFSYVYAPSIVIATFASSVAIPYVTRTAQLVAEGESKNALKSLMVPAGMILALGICAVTVSSFLGSWVLRIMYDEMVATYSRLLMLCMAASTIIGLVVCCRLLLTALRQLKTAIITDTFGLIVSIALCFALIPSIGMYGAAWAILIGSSAQLIAALTVVIQYSKA